MISRAKALKLRELIVKAALSLSDSDAFYGAELFDAWQPDTEYGVGDRRREGDTLYKCLQAHRSQSTWKPSVSPSLWAVVPDPSQEYPEWRQPTGATDAYMKGDKVSHNGDKWVCDMDYNVYEPGVYGWTKV